MAVEPRVNDRIRAKEVRLVAPDGGQIGIKSLEEAKWLSQQLELDLVEVAPDARPPVVRLMDYGKYKYEQSVRDREARKKQTRTVVKEVQFRPKIGGNDFEIKAQRVERFLKEGDKVKVTMRFRGREITHPEIGMGILDRLVEHVGDKGIVEQTAKLDGRSMTLVLGPLARALREQAAADEEEAEAAAEAAAEQDAKPVDTPLKADTTQEQDAAPEDTPLKTETTQEQDSAETEDA